MRRPSVRPIKGLNTKNACTVLATTGVALLSAAGAPASANDHIHIVGSSTVFPFVTTVAEEFGQKTPYATPIVEQLGTGGGFKLFCRGLGTTAPFDYPDIANASRRMKDVERKMCADNGVENVVELKIGYDGIVLANAVNAPTFALTQRQLYLALAASVPPPSTQQRNDPIRFEVIPNPYQNWRDISPTLPDTPIILYGPPQTSGTRDALNALVLKAGCRTFAQLAALEAQDPGQFARLCTNIRADQRYIGVGENDNTVVQKLRADPSMLGILPYSFAAQNSDVVKTASINGVTASPDTIRSGSYPISRSLFVYIKQAHARSIPGIRSFLRETFSNEAMGDYGYLIDKGLIPVSRQERRISEITIDRAFPAQSSTN